MSEGVVAHGHRDIPPAAGTERVLSGRPCDPVPGSRDQNGLEVMTRQESLALLASAPLGRVAITLQALPVILPVSFVLVDGDIVFGTGAGSRLAAAADRQVVAFEADGLDAATGEGWSVCVTGRAAELDGAEKLEAARLLGLWAPARKPRGHIIRISSDVVTGRRMVAAG